MQTKDSKTMYLPKASDADIARYVKSWREAKEERDRKSRAGNERAKFNRDFNRVLLNSKKG